MPAVSGGIPHQILGFPRDLASNPQCSPFHPAAAPLARNAGQSGAADLLKDAALRLLDEDARFRAAVLEGKAYADRGEFIAEAEMDARFEEMFRS